MLIQNVEYGNIQHTVNGRCPSCNEKQTKYGEIAGDLPRRYSMSDYRNNNLAFTIKSSKQYQYLVKTSYILIAVILFLLFLLINSTSFLSHIFLTLQTSVLYLTTNSTKCTFKPSSTLPLSRSSYVSDHVYWSKHAESLVPSIQSMKDLSDETTKRWRRNVIDTLLGGSATSSELVKGPKPTQRPSISQGNSVAYLKADVCGRMQNRMLVLSDSSQLCLRYRPNMDQIQGEMYARQLAVSLGLAARHLPLSLLLVLDTNTPGWFPVSAQLETVGWESGRLAVVTAFEPFSSGTVNVPHFVRVRGHGDDASNLTDNDIGHLVQWSDLMIFDYVTANQDRFVSSLINHQWNTDIMSYPTHNLAASFPSHNSKASVPLYRFFDHEAAFFHGYRLLDRYQGMHWDALTRICVFRQSTIDNIRQLVSLGPNKIAKHLNEGVRLAEADSLNVGYHMPAMSNEIASILIARLQHVLNHVSECERHATTQHTDCL